MAQITLQGNLGRDSELRFTPSGEPVLGFSVADQKRKPNASGVWEDDGPATWWPVTVWGKTAENLVEHLRKGSRVVVTGDVYARPWTDREGNERTSYDVKARTVGIIPKAGQGATAPASDPWAEGPAF